MICPQGCSFCSAPAAFDAPTHGSGKHEFACRACAGRLNILPGAKYWDPLMARWRTVKSGLRADRRVGW